MLSETRLGSILPSAGVPKEYRYLASVMGLPLVDGVFISIVLSGGLTSIADSMLVGLFIFGGFATVSVILSEFDGDKAETMKRTAISCIVIGIIAVLQAALAPSFATVLDTEVFRYGAILALLAISARIFPVEWTNSIPGPTPIILVFLAISLQPEALTIQPDYNLVAAGYTVVAIILSTTVCVSAVLFRDAISDSVDMNVLKMTTAIGLIAIGLNIAGLVPSYTPTFTMFGFVASVRLDNPF